MGIGLTDVEPQLRCFSLLEQNQCLQARHHRLRFENPESPT